MKDIHPFVTALATLFLLSAPVATSAPIIKEKSSDRRSISMVSGKAFITFGI